MFLELGDKTIELKTTLGVTRKIEKRFKATAAEVFEHIGAAEIDEHLAILKIAANEESDIDIESYIMENWDYFDIMMATQELVARLVFSGTTEQMDAKVQKYPVTEAQKNSIRGLLGIPIPTAPDTGESL